MPKVSVQDDNPTLDPEGRYSHLSLSQQLWLHYDREMWKAAKADDFEKADEFAETLLLSERAPRWLKARAHSMFATDAGTGSALLHARDAVRILEELRSLAGKPIHQKDYDRAKALLAECEENHQDTIRNEDRSLPDDQEHELGEMPSPSVKAVNQEDNIEDDDGQGETTPTQSAIHTRTADDMPLPSIEEPSQYDDDQDQTTPTKAAAQTHPIRSSSLMSSSQMDAPSSPLKELTLESTPPTSQQSSPYEGSPSKQSFDKKPGLQPSAQPSTLRRTKSGISAASAAARDRDQGDKQ